jgi:hypothetical protein
MEIGRPPFLVPHFEKLNPCPQAPEIFVFFKHIDSASLADAGPQLQKVLDFRKSLEESRQVLSHGFANEAEFQAEVDHHLRAFAKRELPPADAPRDKVLLPLAVLAEVQKEKAEKEQALARAERGLNPPRHLVNNKLTSGWPSLHQAGCRRHKKPKMKTGIKVEALLFIQNQLQVSNATHTA